MNITEIIKSKKPLVYNRKKFSDHRGFFMPLDQDPAFAGTNISFSKKGTFRGLHYQEKPFEQGKLLTVLKGKIEDFCVDLNPNFSSSYQGMFKVERVLLVANPAPALCDTVWIPPGYAHGFHALKDSIVMYQVTGQYMPSAEKTLDFKNTPFIPDIFYDDLEHIYASPKTIISDKDNPFANHIDTW